MSKSSFRPLASISVDVDVLGCYYKAYGIEGGPGRDPVYSQGVPRYLELFRELGVKATFFLVADDLDQPDRIEVAEKIRDSGHEIASHSLSHLFRFRDLPSVEKERQIVEAGEKIERLLGVKPRGFRVPNWDVDEETIAILASRGYLYDSSVLPSLLLPLLKLIHLLKGGRKQGTTGMGRNSFILAPSRPYFPDKRKLWRKGDCRVLEIPITVSPILQTPFFGTWHLASRYATYPLDFHLLKLFNRPVNYELHPIEMIDNLGGDYHPALDVQPGFSTPWMKKRQRVRDLIKRVKEDYRIMPLQDLAERTISEMNNGRTP